MELRKRHKAHARPLKNLEERYVKYASVIELEASECAGQWKARYFPEATEVSLDLGCGKGQFLVALAQQHPNVLFVGLDYDEICIARAAQLAFEAELSNCVFALADGEEVTDYFAPGELSRIYLNFSTPHPRKKHATERLTYVDQLIKYRGILTEGGIVDMKTDSPPFFEFSLIQFDLAGYDILWETTDMPVNEAKSPVTEYEERLRAKGARICACVAQVADRPYTNEQDTEMSLFPYLPEDLSSLEYVPYGMEGYVFNITNRRAKESGKV